MELVLDKSVAPVVLAITKALSGESVFAEGTWGSFGPMLAGHINEKLQRPVLYVRPHIDDADKAGDDLEVFAKAKVEVFGCWEGEMDLPDATDEIGNERLRLALKLDKSPRNKSGDIIISTSVQALCQPIPNPKSLEKSCLILKTGQEISPDDVIGWLIKNEFERTDRIDLPGQFARRGGIIDIYSPVTTEDDTGEQGKSSGAFRVEFFGDTVESIRKIDLDTQRSYQEINKLSIISTAMKFSDGGELFVNILPSDTIIILEEPVEIEEVAKVFVERLENSRNLFAWEQIYSAINKFSILCLSRFAGAGVEECLKLDVGSVQQYQQKGKTVLSGWPGHKAALADLVAQAENGKKVFLYCESAAEVERITEIIKQIQEKVPKNFKLSIGFIHGGFTINSGNTIVLSHHELFGQFTLRRRPRIGRAVAAIDTFSDLQIGDYVVHLSHGVGKYFGIKTIEKKDGSREYLTIEFADKVKVYVPVQNVSLVQKYIGTVPKRPKLNKVGSKRWQKQKEKVERSVKDFASELVNLQAERISTEGIKYGKDTTWQKEFEESFAYQETDDQITVAEQIKADMQVSVPMDRLLCGDVGYGKTELSMRGAFKAVEGGKQVAVLVPTTVLSVQHSRTFAERFADFPISIAVLNRFNSLKKNAEIIKKAKAGKVDIVIGTHRLFSNDVGFKDLGLLVVDEEQRFGVEHKEKLKQLRVNVDVLTMTATPIPRTLHLAMLGIRDISSLATPPLDRRSVVTNVCRYDKGLIRNAILRELNRQGQVFFLHNRVKSIDKKADDIQQLVPEARLAIAHGQMAKRELEKAMIDFVTGNVDVLVCTTIIESGLDIPNANTIFINNADRFGLAELHQLRGRVGRYKHRAYAYMMITAGRSITPVAVKRLKAIEEYSQLGAGFKIALRDLEIRGAGNILGAEQSGHIQAIGYQMYCELLGQAVRRLRNEPGEEFSKTVIDLGFTTYIPKNYIPSDRQRLDVYRRISMAKTIEDVERLTVELEDLFGALPGEMETVLDMARLRVHANARGIKSVVVDGQNLIFAFKDNAISDDLFANVKTKVRTIDNKTASLRLEKAYLEPGTLTAFLRKILIPVRVH